MFSSESLSACRQKLLNRKADILNRVRENHHEWLKRDHKGDETDLSVGLMEEDRLLTHQIRLKQELVEIEAALARIENGTYGICEETEEAIESARLFSIPWTRFSIEGAEIRESLQKRFKR